MPPWLEIRRIFLLSGLVFLDLPSSRCVNKCSLTGIKSCILLWAIRGYRHGFMMWGPRYMKKPRISLYLLPLISKHELVKNFTYLHPYNAPWAILQADPIHLVRVLSHFIMPRSTEKILSSFWKQVWEFWHNQFYWLLENCYNDPWLR